MLKDLPQNTRVTLLLNLFSSTLASILFFYAALYMQGVGLRYLDKAEVRAYWLYGFRSAEGTMRDIGLLKAAKDKLERLGKEAYIVCEPVGHPDPNQKTLPAGNWLYRINCDGIPDYGSADIEENLVRDLVAATKAFRDAGFTKVFYDDDVRMGNWGTNITGCFCEACIADFNRRHGAR